MGYFFKIYYTTRSSLYTGIPLQIGRSVNTDSSAWAGRGRGVSMCSSPFYRFFPEDNDGGIIHNIRNGYIIYTWLSTGRKNGTQTYHVHSKPIFTSYLVLHVKPVPYTYVAISTHGQLHQISNQYTQSVSVLIPNPRLIWLFFCSSSVSPAVVCPDSFS